MNYDNYGPDRFSEMMFTSSAAEWDRKDKLACQRSAEGYRYRDSRRKGNDTFMKAIMAAIGKQCGKVQMEGI